MAHAGGTRRERWRSSGGDDPRLRHRHAGHGGGGDRRPASRSRPRSRRATTGGPLTARSCSRRSRSRSSVAGGWAGIEPIAVGVGPGSFTGLRIGVATARALAQARGLPLAGVATTSALLAGIAEDPAAGAPGSPSSTPAAARSSPRSTPATGRRIRSSALRTSWPQGSGRTRRGSAWRPATARYDFGPRSRRWASRCSPPRIPRIGSRQGTSAPHRGRLEPGSARAGDADVSETARRATLAALSEITATELRSDLAAELRVRRLTYGDLPGVLSIERRSFPGALVAGDVRARALQAVGGLPGGGGPERDRRLPDLLALRGRLAPDERRRRSRPAAPRRRRPA